MNLHKTLATVSGMTMLSRITGLLRELLIARAFGASAYTDAFFVAFRIPNLLRRLFAEGAFSQAFVPILAQYKNREGDAVTRGLIDRVATLLFLALAATGARHGARADRRLFVGAGLRRRAWKIRGYGPAPAHHLPLHRVHLA